MDKEQLRQTLLSEKERLTQQLETGKSNINAIHGALSAVEWMLKKFDEEMKAEPEKEEKI